MSHVIPGLSQDRLYVVDPSDTARPQLFLLVNHDGTAMIGTVEALGDIWDTHGNYAEPDGEHILPAAVWALTSQGPRRAGVKVSTDAEPNEYPKLMVARLRWSIKDESGRSVSVSVAFTYTIRES